MKEPNGRRETRYYLMNVAKPPLDDLTARMAIAYAIDRDQINQIRNNGVYDISNGPFDSKVPGYVKNTGFPKFNLKKATALAKQYKDAHGGQFSVVLEHTNDPANTAEADLIKQQLSKAGIDASTKQDDQTAFINQAVTGNFSIMLWRQHPGDDPDGQYVWWNTGSLVNFGKIADPAAADADGPGTERDRPGQAQGHLPAGRQAVRRQGVQRLGLLRRLDRRGEEERAGAGRPTASRRRRQARVHLRASPGAGHVVELGELTG